MAESDDYCFGGNQRLQHGSSTAIQRDRPQYPFEYVMRNSFDHHGIGFDSRLQGYARYLAPTLRQRPTQPFPTQLKVNLNYAYCVVNNRKPGPAMTYRVRTITALNLRSGDTVIPDHGAPRKVTLHRIQGAHPVVVVQFEGIPGVKTYYPPSMPLLIEEGD